MPVDSKVAIMKRIRSKVSVNEKKKIIAISAQWRHHVQKTDRGYQCNYFKCGEHFDHIFSPGDVSVRPYDLNDALGRLESHIADRHSRITVYYCSVCEQAVSFRDILEHKETCKSDIYNVFGIVKNKRWGKRNKTLNEQAGAEAALMKVLRSRVMDKEKRLYYLWRAALEACEDDCTYCDYKWADTRDMEYHLRMDHYCFKWYYCSHCCQDWSMAHKDKCKGFKVSMLRIMGGFKYHSLTPLDEEMNGQEEELADNDKGVKQSDKRGLSRAVSQIDSLRHSGLPLVRLERLPAEHTHTDRGYYITGEGVQLTVTAAKKERKQQQSTGSGRDRRAPHWMKDYEGTFDPCTASQMGAGDTAWVPV